MLKLKGQTESGEWVEFWVYDIANTDEVWTDAWCLSHGGSRVDDIKTSTIQLATPDLLACLKMALVNIEANGFGMPRVQEKIRQVIRQAEGRTEDSI